MFCILLWPTLSWSIVRLGGSASEIFVENIAAELARLLISKNVAVEKTEPSEPTQRVEPGLAPPVEPVEPVVEATQLEPTQPVEPVEPTQLEAVQPQPPVEPVVAQPQPVEPVEPTQPAPSQPQPVEPAEPSPPVVSTQPVPSQQPVEPTSQPQPVELAEPSPPVVPTQPVPSQQPVEPTSQPQPVEPLEPSQPIPPIVPTRPGAVGPSQAASQQLKVTQNNMGLNNLVGGAASDAETVPGELEVALPRTPSTMRYTADDLKNMDEGAYTLISTVLTFFLLVLLNLVDAWGFCPRQIPSWRSTPLAWLTSA